MGRANCFIASLFACLALNVASAEAQTAKWLEQARLKLVNDDLVEAGIQDERVLNIMRQTPRHEFVNRDQWAQAYLDTSLPIGDKQTISAPFIVAYMTEQLDPQPTDKVLEIGTGSGYQAAVLSPLVKEVYSIEIVEPLGKRAARTLARLGYRNVFTKVGDGYQGWPEHAPFDKIIVTCSPEKVPEALVEQLAEGGVMVIPVGERYQQTLYMLRKKNGKLEEEKLLPTLFVPMTGAAEDEREVQPDPKNPCILNGSFEQDQPGEVPSSWHHPRQVVVAEDAKSPDGTKHILFTNSEAGRGCQLMQAFAIDGQSIRQLDFSAWVSTNGIRPGQSREQLPFVVFTFFDKNRGQAGPPVLIGPFTGISDWQQFKKRVVIPPQTREVILLTGLLGATGEMRVDKVELSPVVRGQ